MFSPSTVCCFKIIISSTYKFHITDTIRWLLHGILKLLIPSNDELLCGTIDDPCDTLQLYVNNNILPTEINTSRKPLIYLNFILNNRDLRDTPTKPPTPTYVPRFKFQTKDPNIITTVKLHSNDITRYSRVQSPAATPSPQPIL